jgi:hypothetical protein
MLLLTLQGCSFLGLGSDAPPTSARASSSSGNGFDTLVEQVLSNMHLHAWNPQAMTKGVVTGGLYINWKMDDPAQTNRVRPGPDGSTQSDHDPQVDLLYLTALAEYHQLHSQSHTFDDDLRRATALVLVDFQRYSVPKGWIYFYLLKDAQFLGNSGLADEAHAFARNLYTTWYDPALGLVYNRAHIPGDYQPNHILQGGAALIDAGHRWHEAGWSVAGERSLDHVLDVAFDPHYHLFYDSMSVDRSGHEQVQVNKARPSTEGEAVSALVTAYQLTHHRRYLDVAGEVLQSLFGSSGLWDRQRGGFFFALQFDSGSVVTSYKETRSQSLTLIGLYLYNMLRHQQFARQEQQLIDVLVQHFYQSSYHGFVYRLTPDFQIYVSKPGAGIGVEDYFTSEAMGSSLDALQRTRAPSTTL